MSTTNADDSLDFDDALHTTCPRCEVEAQWHRVSPSGNLYCFELSPIGRKEVKIRSKWGWQESMMHSMPVKYLRKSPIGQDVGMVINEGLSSYVNL